MTPCRLGIVIDPLEKLNPFKDSTLGIIRAAMTRDWDVTLFHVNALNANPQGIYASGQHILSIDSELLETKPYPPSHTASHGATTGAHAVETEWVTKNFSELDLVLMRKDPPYTTQYHFACQLLSLAERDGLLVANNPQSLRDCNEKLFTLQFPDCTAPTLVSSRLADIRAFANEQGTIIIKPLDGMGGQGIFKIDAQQTNLPVVVELLTNSGQTPIMAQRYLPQITEGDKRVLMVNGEIVPYLLARIPQGGDVRGNLAAGGRGVVQAITDTESAIGERVGPVLKEKGIYLAGLDIIGDRLTEINITSPTCLREIERETQLDVAGDLLDHLLTRCNRRSAPRN